MDLFSLSVAEFLTRITVAQVVVVYLISSFVSGFLVAMVRSFVEEGKES